MVATRSKQQRYELAKSMGLGRKRQQEEVAEPSPKGRRKNAA
jgi:predicted transcriptional regulator